MKRTITKLFCEYPRTFLILSTGLWFTFGAVIGVWMGNATQADWALTKTYIVTIGSVAGLLFGYIGGILVLARLES